MRVIVYKCTLCENSWEEEHVFGVNVDKENGAVKLVDADEEETHICRNCMQAVDQQINGEPLGPGNSRP